MRARPLCLSLHLTSVLTSYSAASLCGVTAGLYGAFKQRSPGNFFLLSAVNSGIAAATFFSAYCDLSPCAVNNGGPSGLREYIVGPALVLTLPGKQYRLRRHRLIYAAGGPTHDEPPLSWADIRISRLLDSGISGALAGGILNTWKRMSGLKTLCRLVS
jgi:hypothetical protein